MNEQFCPILVHAGAISDAIAYATANSPTDVSIRGSEYHNHGHCMGTNCVFMIDGECAFVKNVRKKSSIIKALDYINVSIRDLIGVIRALR